MNPEIRFRVPDEVYRAAEEMAQELGFGPTSSGRTGGVSKLARLALVALLDLPLPEDAHLIQSGVFAGLRAAQEGKGTVRVQVLHRVDNDFRKQAVLGGRGPVPETATTVFELAPEAVPPELVPHLGLTPEGVAYASLRLDGYGGPATLVSRSEQASLDEVRDCLGGPARLRQWALEQGSELLRTRLEEGFEWRELALREFSAARLEEAGLKPKRYLPETVGLAPGGEAPLRLLRVQEPGLESLRRLREVRSRLPDGKAGLVAREDGSEHVVVTVAVPGVGQARWLL